MKFRCTICGYIAENEAPEFCPVCKAPKDKFVLVDENSKAWADEHKIGVAQGLDKEVVEGYKRTLQENVQKSVCTWR